MREPNERAAIVPRSSWDAPRYLILVAALTVLGAWLRFSAIGFGLPDDPQHLFRPDEEHVVLPALNLGPDWDPHTIFYPAALMYLQNGVFRSYALLHGHGDDFRAFYARDNDQLAILIARRLTAVLGTATIPLIYFAIAPLWGVFAGIGAASILTFVTFHVCASKFATTDVAAGFWTTLAIAMLLRMARCGSRRNYLLAGIFVGVATATKYPACFLAFSIAITHFELTRREKVPLLGILRDGRIYLSGFAAAAAFFILTPYLFLNWHQTVSNAVFLYGASYGMAKHYGWPWLLTRAMPDCFDVVIELLILVGIVLALIRPQPGRFGVACFALLELFAIANLHRAFYRYLLIPLPAFAILAAIAASDLKEQVAVALGRRNAAALVASFLAAALMPFFVRDIQLNRLLRRTDTRILAERWIEKNISPLDAIAVTTQLGFLPYGKPQLPPSYRTVPMQDLAALKAANTLWVMFDSLGPLSRYSFEPSAIQQTELAAQAALVFDVNPIRPGSPMPIFDGEDAFYAPLANITSMERPGPRIRIWKLK